MTKAVPTIALCPSAATLTLTRPVGFKPVSVSVGLNGSAVRLLVPEEIAARLFETVVQPGWASFPTTKTEGDYSSMVVISGRPGGSEELRLSGLTATYPIIEALPDNQVLVVAPRCRRFPDGSHELNAKVYDSSGGLKREFLLGDGIEHVQADVRGNIWVGYFDEGVYGNFGWQAGDTFGAAGLSCFSDSGQKLWDFQPPEGFDAISDCYALNVCRQAAWAYYYTGFPFVRIDSHWQVRCWETESAGGKTFAVAEQKILLYGGYRDEGTSCKLFEIDGDSTKLVANISLVLPIEVDLSKSTVIGRDTELHVISGDDWHRFSLESLG
jgi:hypothetical protein